ncbi:MAG: PilN domain-containing protein [Candidatus Pacebacteria bacterium]|jgi:Tfp pilus assembly protein PilN|nr:PilN domain-containing protein [Candidatus Paceibacterota bacterium]
MPRVKSKRKKQAPIVLDVNLMPKDPFFETALGRSLKWTVSVGRYIVIFTQLVVIFSFLTRFILDRQVTDLNVIINQQKTAIEAYSDLEKNFLFVQAQIDDVEQLQQESNLIEIFPLLNETIPSNIILDELTIKQNEVIFSGIALSQTALNILVNNVKLSAYFNDVSMEKIESRGENLPGLSFDMRAKIVKTANSTEEIIK